MVRARRGVREFEFQPRHRRLDLAQHFKRGSHNFRADAVAGEDCNVECVVGEHFVFPRRRCGWIKQPDSSLVTTGLEPVVHADTSAYKF
jgi:hypothetical protein